MTLTSRIRNEALRLGFDFCGFSEAKPSPRADAFGDWIGRGRHAGMGWIARDPERRLDPQRVLPGAVSLISVALSYYLEDPPATLWNDPLRGRVARYAWGRDYHDVMLPMLEELAAFVRSEAGVPVCHRAYVDTGPVLERDVAARAGLGFIGKNTLLIHPRAGSYMLLGEVLVDVPLDPDLEMIAEAEKGTCGDCRRCQDVCPTHAFPVPYVLDSNLCISYLTIELKGSIPEPLRPKMGNWIFGCDECQSVCPWVKQYATASKQRFLKYEPDWAAPSLLELIQLDDKAFKDRFAGSPILRPKRKGLLRNVAVALGNSGRPEAIPSLEKATKDPEPLIAEHASWALSRLGR